MAPVEQIDDMTEVGQLDQDQWETYVPAQGGKPLPPKGAYSLRLPQELPDSAFEIKERKDRDGRVLGKYLQITLDPVTIVGGEYDGTEVRFIRVSTDRVRAFGTQERLVASTAADVLINFLATDRPSSPTLFLGPNGNEENFNAAVEVWKRCFRQLCDQVTPTPVYMVWRGYDKLASGKAKYLKEADFPRLPDGTRPNYIVRQNLATGEEYKVYARLEPTDRGFYPKS